jgi:DNA-binding MarR family transcriptional regulator
MVDHSSKTKTDRAALLSTELRSLVGRMKRRLREQGNAGDLPPSQVAVLLRLERNGPATASGLARAEGMRPQSMGAILEPLQESGLVSGAPDPGDGRQILLSLTDRCRTWIREGRAARQDWLSCTIQARLSTAEQEELARAAALLSRLLD